MISLIAKWTILLFGISEFLQREARSVREQMFTPAAAPSMPAETACT